MKKFSINWFWKNNSLVAKNLLETVYYLRSSAKYENKKNINFNQLVNQ